MTKFITRYNYTPSDGLINDQDSCTYQECKDDCDINILYRKYLSKGLTPPNITQLEQRYSDMSDVQSFEELLNVQNDVKSMFNDLPSDIRESCGYNVDNFVRLISKPSDDLDVQDFQSEVLQKLGMYDREKDFKEEIEFKKNGEIQLPPKPLEEKVSEEKPSTITT